MSKMRRCCLWISLFVKQRCGYRAASALAYLLNNHVKFRIQHFNAFGSNALVAQQLAVLCRCCTLKGLFLAGSALEALASGEV